MFVSFQNFNLILTSFKLAFVLLSTITLTRLLFSPTLANMENLDRPFTIELNGSPIARVDDNAEEMTHAKTGSEPAVFTLRDGRLQQGDWVLGRFMVEDRSLLPKRVLWFRPGNQMVQPVVAHQDGGNVKLKFADATLMLGDGDHVFAEFFQGKTTCTSQDFFR
jgi:hypothetical protein